MRDIILLLIGFGVGYWFTERRFKVEKGRFSQDSGGAKESIIKKQAEEKAKNREEILKAFETRGRLTNNDLEKLLGISDATATRYLSELKNEGKIRQVGDTGSGVYYEKIN